MPMKTQPPRHRSDSWVIAYTRYCYTSTLFVSWYSSMTGYSLALIQLLHCADRSFTKATSAAAAVAELIAFHLVTVYLAVPSLLPQSIRLPISAVVLEMCGILKCPAGIRSRYSIYRAIRVNDTTSVIRDVIIVLTHRKVNPLRRTCLCISYNSTVRSEFSYTSHNSLRTVFELISRMWRTEFRLLYAFWRDQSITLGK